MNEITENTSQQNIKDLKQLRIGLYSQVFFCVVVLLVCVYGVCLGVFIREESWIDNSFMMIIIVVVGIWLRRTLRLTTQMMADLKNAEQENLINITSNGKMQKKIVPFSEEDTKQLQNQTRIVYTGLVIIGGVFFSLTYYLYKMFFVLNESLERNLFQTMVTPLLAVVIVYLVYSVIQVQKDLNIGQKEVLTGILTDKAKIHNQSSSSAASSAGFRSSSSSTSTSSSSRTDYYFYIEGQEIAIDNSIQYDKVEIGQRIILQRTVKSQIILKIDVLNETENETE